MASDLVSESLSPHLRVSADQLWARLEFAFEDNAGWLQSLRLEDEGEAVDRSSPREFVYEYPSEDPWPEREAVDLSNPSVGEEEARLTIKHPLLIPFRRTDDAEELRSCFEQARAAISELRALFKARAATPEFLLQWGVFQYCCGFVNAAYFSRGDDLGPIRSSRRGAQAKSKSSQHKWVAHLLLRQIEAGRDRQLAERDVAQAVRDLLSAGKFPAGFSPKWFQDILQPDDQLRTTYCRKHLTMPEIRALAAEPTDDIPTTSVQVPST